MKWLAYALFLFGAVHSAITLSHPILHIASRDRPLITFAIQVAANYVGGFANWLLAIAGFIVPGIAIPSAYIAVGSVFIFVFMKVFSSTYFSVRRQNALIAQILSARGYSAGSAYAFTKKWRAHTSMRRMGYAATVLATAMSLPLLLYLHGEADWFDLTDWSDPIGFVFGGAIVITFLLMSLSASFAPFAVLAQGVSLSVIISVFAFLPGDAQIMFYICFVLSLAIIIATDATAYVYERWRATEDANAIALDIERVHLKGAR